MARSPVLVWRNATRIRLINAIPGRLWGTRRRAAGEAKPLICDGIELH